MFCHWVKHDYFSLDTLFPKISRPCIWPSYSWRKFYHSFTPYNPPERKYLVIHLKLWNWLRWFWVWPDFNFISFHVTTMIKTELTSVSAINLYMQRLKKSFKFLFQSLNKFVEQYEVPKFLIYYPIFIHFCLPKHLYHIYLNLHLTISYLM